jgi:Ca2+ transporting ATPase
MANAVGKPPTEAELQRVKVGYAKLTYLLDNFDAETTICRENGGECKRDADPVRKYLGLRSTTDPLFQIEKVFEKVKYMDIDPDQIEIYFEAIEEWNTAQNMSNSMAFISQFAEYNPGGGKDEVLKYLEEAKKQVVIARGSLEKIIKVIDL